jgi:hypothetical protein
MRRVVELVCGVGDDAEPMGVAAALWAGEYV